MATYPKATFFFQDDAYGWSETFYTIPFTTLANLIAQAVVLASLRVKMLASGPFNTAIRCSVEGDYRRSQTVPGVAPIRLPGLRPVYDKNYGGAGLDSDLPYSVTLLKMAGGERYRRVMYLSGVADSEQLDPVGNYGAEFMKLYGVWVKELTSGRWGFKAVNTDPGTNPLKTITNVSNASPFMITCPGHGFATGSSVRISGVKLLTTDVNGVNTTPRINGVWGVANNTADTFTLIGSTGTATYIAGGTAQQRTPVVTPITAVNIERETRRARGLPFGHPVGRRRSRLRRH